MNWHDWFVYDETSPSCLRWKVDRGPVKTGDAAGSQREDGYWLVGLHGKNHLVHRIVYEMIVGDIPDGYEVDHEDGFPTNSRWKNLRAIPKVVNQRNMARNKRNTSGTTGVSRVDVVGRKGRVYSYWTAHWKDEYSQQHIKHFSVANLGEVEAKRLAILLRETEIKRLNALGLGYTERHGTTCSTPDSSQSPNP